MLSSISTLDVLSDLKAFRLQYVAYVLMEFKLFYYTAKLKQVANKLTKGKQSIID